MSNYDYDLIVIGGGAAGLTAATFAGQSAAKTLLIEKEEKLGGDCLHFGCVPSKTLIKSASTYHLIQHAEKYGLPRAAVPPVDFKLIKNRIQQTIDHIQKHDEPAYLSKKYNVETIFGEPQFIDQHVIEIDGKKISSRYFIIATGSSALVPPIDGLKNTPYLTNVNIFSLEKFPDRLIVLGGGPIGLEMAQAFSRLGSKVSVIEAAPQLLPKEDKDISDFVQNHLIAEGVDVVINSKAVKVEYQSGNFSVTVNNASTSFNGVISGDALLVAVGRKANVEGMSLEKAGIEYSPRAIKVNKKMQTTSKNIFACGDVNGGYQFTHVASYEAIVAVTNAILKFPTISDYTNTPWVTYLSPEIASIGFNETRAREAGIQFNIHIEPLKDNDRALAEGENTGFLKLILNKRGRVIGVQIVGYRAGDLISEWIPILNGRLGLSAITRAIHPYPTLSEINKTAAVNYTVSTIPSWTKKLIKLVFGYQGKV